MTSDNYIKFKEKPILSINNPYKLTSRIKIISTLRSSVQKQIGKIFLIYPFKGNYTKAFFLKQFDGVYDSSKIDLFKEIKNNPINNTLFRTCIINSNFNDYKKPH